LKPIITLYSEGRAELTKKFDNFVDAAFWVGVESAEQDLESVKIRLSPMEDYDVDVADAKHFSSLLVDRGINFSFEFFVEPIDTDRDASRFVPPPPPASNPPTENRPESGFGSKATREDLKSALVKDLISRREYEEYLAGLESSS